MSFERGAGGRRVCCFQKSVSSSVNRVCLSSQRDGEKREKKRKKKEFDKSNRHKHQEDLLAFVALLLFFASQFN